VNRRFAAERPDVPAASGVPKPVAARRNHQNANRAGAARSARGIGDHDPRVAHGPNARKPEEIAAGRQILADIAEASAERGRFRAEDAQIISCPSCSRVENEAFIELASR